jgi:hypothetical protein
MPTYSANDAQPVAFRKPDKTTGRRLGKPQTQEQWELASCIATVFGATEHLAREVHLIVSEDQDAMGRSYAALIALD